MMHQGPFSPRPRRAPFFVALSLACVIAGLVPRVALAAPVLTLGLRFIPAELIAGDTVELPLLLVENRSADDVSLFAGGDRLAQVYSQIISEQSTFLSFTPAAAFTTPYVTLTDHRIDFNLIAGAGVNSGLPVTVDNGGIDGRTEIEIGTVKLEVGPEIPGDPGDPPTIFFCDLATDHSGSNNAVKQFNNTDIRESLGGIYSRTIQVFPPVPPVVIPTDLRKRLRVQISPFKITGTASDDVTVKKVEAKLNKGPYVELKLKATNNPTKVKWTFNAALQPGKNVIKFRATDNDDNPSEVVKQIRILE
jgi:hypothetical protein